MQEKVGMPTFFKDEHFASAKCLRFVEVNISRRSSHWLEGDGRTGSEVERRSRCCSPTCQQEVTYRMTCNRGFIRQQDGPVVPLTFATILLGTLRPTNNKFLGHRRVCELIHKDIFGFLVHAAIIHKPDAEPKDSVPQSRSGLTVERVLFMLPYTFAHSNDKVTMHQLGVAGIACPLSADHSAMMYWRNKHWTLEDIRAFDDYPFRSYGLHLT